MRQLLLILLLSVFTIAIFASEEDSLYTKLRPQAIANLKPLPNPLRKEFRRLLQRHPDALMAFLLASEENGKLRITDPAVLSQHYDSVKPLYLQRDRSQSLAFFFSYIAKATVSDERITNYRNIFEDLGLLSIREQNPDLYERTRMVNLWVRQYLEFKPTSGIDQSPLNILFQSRLGRCEEMQILFVAAARTAGIPARPAFTSSWPHMDNNHAWAEVFVNGSWQYLGAVEPEYDLNHTWFSSMVDKAVVILADSAYPSKNEEVLSQDRYGAMVNSTTNYATKDRPTRKIRVLVVDEQNHPVVQGTVSILVYNWGLLRNIARIQTDSTGTAVITTSSGAFVVSAAKADKAAWQFVPMSQNHQHLTLTLKQGLPKLQSLVMEYPKPQQLSWNNPAWFDTLRQDTYQIYKDKLATDLSHLPRDSSLSQDSLATKVWERCRLNGDSFRRFWVQSKPDSTFLTLLSKMDEKLLWQATVTIFDNLYKRYQAIQQSGEFKQEELLANLLSPVALYEMIVNETIQPDLTQWRNLPYQERITAISKALDNRYKIDNSKAIVGIVPASYSQYDKTLTAYNYKILAVEVMRANFVPANYNMLPDMLTLWDKQGWCNYNLNLHNWAKEEVGDTTHVAVHYVLRDENKQPIRVTQEQAVLAQVQQGQFYDNDVQLDVLPDGELSGKLLPGSYVLQIGYRPNQEKTCLTLVPMNLHVGQAIDTTLVLPDYIKTWNVVDSTYLALVKDAPTNGKDIILLLGNYSTEMVQRTSDKILSQRKEQDFWWWGALEHKGNASYVVNSAYKQFLEKHPAARDWIVTLYYSASKQQWQYFEGFWESLPQ